MTNQIKSITLLGGSLAFFVTIFYIALTGPKYDERNCLIGSEPPRTFAALIDLTDKRSDVALEWTKHHLQCAQSRVGLSERFVVSMLFGGEQQNPTVTQIFDQCRPNDTNDFDAVTQGERHVEEVWNEDWVASLDDAIESLAALDPAKSSPLMYAVEATLASTDAVLLYFFSDLMEFSKRGSAYGNGKIKSEPLQSDNTSLIIYQYDAARTKAGKTAFEQFLANVDPVYYEINEQTPPIMDQCSF